MFGDPMDEAAVRQRPRSGSRLTVSLVAVLSAMALLAAGCASGSPQSSARHHASKQAAAERPVTKPQILTTTSSTAATTTTTSVKASPPVHVAPPPASPPATTTTAAPLPPGCNWSNFATTVATDQAAYSTGQTVHITLTFHNAGPACTVNETGYGCPEVDIESGGLPTWTSAPEPNTGCAVTITPGSPTVLASTWSQSYPVDWTQVDCSSRSGGPNVGTCAGNQVPPGQYLITGQDVHGSSAIPPSAPLAVTIS